MSTVVAARGLSRAVWILVVARAVNRIGAFTLPFLGVVLSVEFKASLSQTGLILAVFGAATTVLTSNPHDCLNGYDRSRKPETTEVSRDWSSVF